MASRNKIVFALTASAAIIGPFRGRECARVLRADVPRDF